jgi:DNA topoisomerase-1
MASTGTVSADARAHKSGAAARQAQAGRKARVQSRRAQPRRPGPRRALLRAKEAGETLNGGPCPGLEVAEQIGLSYVTDDAPGYRRKRAGSGFSYLDTNGKALRDETALFRIRQLAIPPAWEQVWICADAQGHLQATGRDAKGRKQYRYHPDFLAARGSVKYERLVDFAAGLPALRREVDRLMGERGLTRNKVLATIVHLLDTTFIRIGNDSYARENDSYGLSTLRDKHAQVKGATLKFQFKGKSGKIWNVRVQNRRVARIVRSCQELPGQHLFQYLDEAGQQQRVSSTDVNAFLREVAGKDITAKDFRTWAGTVLAALELAAMEPHTSPTEAKRQAKRALEAVAHRLGNTVTICRKCYVHPSVLDAHLGGKLRLNRAKASAKHHALRPEEVATLRFLKRAA